MRQEAATEVEAVEHGAMQEVRLLVETGYIDEARALVGRLRAGTPGDIDLLGLQVWIDHRRGAVSEALDGWRLLHEARPNGSVAMARLAQLRAEETTRTQRSDLPAVRRVLRLVAAGQHERALVACSQSRAALAAGDREQRKLLALIEALLHELAARPAAAAAVLTTLGRDPAFAHDVDRLAILARVCEQAGDRSGLQAAERVLGFLAASGILSAYPRLRQIARARGDDGGAAEVERRWEEAFRRRIYQLQPDERLAALARRYVEPKRLAGAEFPARDAVSDPLELAIRDLLEGDAGAALPHLGRQPAWRAEALEMLGDHAGARAAAVEAMQQEPTLAHALLLTRLADGREPVEAAGLRQARRVLEQATAHGPADAALLQARASVEALLGDEVAATQLRERAAAAAGRRWPAPGVVSAAAVYALPGRAIGLVHQLIVRPVPAPSHARGRLLDREIHGEVGAVVRQQLRRIFAAVRECLTASRPERADAFDRCAWSIHFTKEDEPSGGPSLGLPAAIAFASALLDQPVPGSLVFTGAVSYDAVGRLSVRPVGDLGRKIEAALHVGATALVLPGAQAEEALSGQVVPPAFAREVVRPVATFDEALALAIGG